MQRKIGLLSRAATGSTSGHECVFESQMTKVLQDQIVRDLNQILSRLDCLGLYMAGAHLASAIDLVQNEGVAEQAS